MSVNPRPPTEPLRPASSVEACEAIANRLRAQGVMVTADLRVDTAGAALLIGVSPATLRNWRHAEMGPPWFAAGRPWYRIAAILEWIETRARG